MAKKAAPEAGGFAQLKSDLKQKRLGRCYLLWGQEDYLRRYYLAAMRRQLIDELTEGFNYHWLTPENFSLQALSDCVEALPMMAERSMVLVEEVDLFALGETERSQLAELLQDLPEYCCLVFHYESYQPDKRKKKLYEALSASALLCQIDYQGESELRAWLLRHFKAAGKSIEPELCSYLLELCGLSMTRLHGEVEKICAYSGAQQIVRADIDAVVEPTLEAVVFQIGDALAQRRFDQALEHLHTMFKLRAEPIPILAAIGAQMRRLRAARVLMAEGGSAQELASLCGLASFAANKTMTQARRLSDAFCTQAVLLCCRTDQELKSSYDEPQRLLELLIVRLAQEASHA